MAHVSTARSLLRKWPFSRTLRLLIFTACLTAFVVLSSVSLGKFARGDIVKSFEVDEAAPQAFAVTLCRIQEDFFDPEAYEAITGRQLPEFADQPMESLVRDFPWGGDDLDWAVWNMTYSWEDTVKSCSDYYNTPCDRSDVTSALYQYGGQCHTVKYHDLVADGVPNGLWLSLEGVRCQNCGRHHWNVFVHSAIDHYMDWEHVWAPVRAQIELGKEQRLKVTRTMEINLHSSERPCNERENYSRANCIRGCLFRHLSRLGPGCRLPWMPTALPVCQTAAQFRAVYSYTRMLSRIYVVWRYTPAQLRDDSHYAALKRIEADCRGRCIAQCRQEVITISLADRINKRDRGTWVGFSIAEGLYVSRQRVAYDRQQMISDIGGNLGLLLGASAFTLYEFLESCVRRFWRLHGAPWSRVAAASEVAAGVATGHDAAPTAVKVAAEGRNSCRRPAGRQSGADRALGARV